MSTFSAQPAERTKKRGKAISILGLVILLSLLAGCNGNGGSTEFSMIETPSAIRHFVGSAANPDNLANYQVGYFKGNGLAFERPLLDGGTMWSYPRENLGSIPDLSGAVFSIVLDDQWSHPSATPFPDVSFAEIVNHVAVLEFRFPQVTDPGVTEINWFVTPHLVCTYEVEKSDILVSNNTDLPPDPFIWFEYIVYEDPRGMIDLMESGELGLDLMSSGWENEQEYIFTSDTSDGISGTLLATNDERSGTIDVLPGERANLFIGVSVQLRTYENGDRIQIGGTSLPTSLSDSDRCTLDFGSNSYYTMRPAGND